MRQAQINRGGILLLALFCAAALLIPPQILRGASPQEKPQTISANDLKMAEKAFQTGHAAEKDQDWQTAFDSYSEAARLYPGHLPYLQAREFARSRLVQNHIDIAERQAAVGSLSEARQEMRLAAQLDPSDTIIKERLNELHRMAPDIPLEEPVDLSKEVHLDPTPGIFSYHLRGDTKSAYEEVARQFGLHVYFDPDLRARPVRLDASDLSFKDIMGVLGLQTGTFYSATTPKLFVVAEDNIQKRRAFDQSVVRTIPLGGSSTTEQMVETYRVAREITNVPRMELNTAGREITVRASPRDAELVSELVQSLQQPRGQLVLEIEILEVDRDSASNIGVIPPQSGTIYSISKAQIELAEQSSTGLVTVLQEIFGTPSSLSGYSSTQLGQLVSGGQISGSSLIPPVLAFGGGGSTFLYTLPGAAVNFSDMLTTVKSGQRVLLRAQDGEPATFFVGDRVPISLASYSASLGSSTFTPSVSGETFPTVNYATGVGPAGIASADFNNDGFQDLVTANQTPNTASILLGNGDGTFQTNVDYPTGMAPDAVAVGDFNGDGNMDIAVANSCGNDATCKSPGTVSILLGNGDGTFGAKTDYPAGNFPTSIAVDDFNGDGNLDLAVTNNRSNTVSIFLGKGDGTFAAKVDYITGTGPISVATADFNSDGFEDMAVAQNTANTVSIFLGNGDGTFKARVDYATGNGPTAVAVADFNLDSIPDVAVTNGTDDTVSVLLGNGDGTLGPESPYITDGDPVALAIGDVNVDGFPDIVTVDKSSNDVSILLNVGDGTFAVPLFVPVGTTPEAITSADFNGDSLPDAAIANFGSNNATVLLDTATFSPSGGSGLSQTPFPGAQYEDIGLKVKATPRLHDGGDVTLQLSIELKSLSPASFNGIPVISNRTVEQTVRVKENETSILAGILDDEEMKTLDGLPYVYKVPVLGQLLTNNAVSDQRTELLILITPRLVEIPTHNSRQFYAGRGEGMVGPRMFAPPGVFPRFPPGEEGRTPPSPPDNGNGAPFNPQPQQENGLPGQQPGIPPTTAAPPAGRPNVPAPP